MRHWRILGKALTTPIKRIDLVARFFWPLPLLTAIFCGLMLHAELDKFWVYMFAMDTMLIFNYDILIDFIDPHYFNQLTSHDFLYMALLVLIGFSIGGPLAIYGLFKWYRYSSFHEESINYKNHISSGQVWKFFQKWLSLAIIFILLMKIFHIMAAFSFLPFVKYLPKNFKDLTVFHYAAFMIYFYFLPVIAASTFFASTFKRRSVNLAFMALDKRSFANTPKLKKFKEINGSFKWILVASLVLPVFAYNAISFSLIHQWSGEHYFYPIMVLININLVENIDSIAGFFVQIVALKLLANLYLALVFATAIKLYYTNYVRKNLLAELLNEEQRATVGGEENIPQNLRTQPDKTDQAKSARWNMIDSAVFCIMAITFAAPWIYQLPWVLEQMKRLTEGMKGHSVEYRSLKDNSLKVIDFSQKPLKVGASFKECSTCPEMIVVPAGKYNMGSSESESARGYGEEQIGVTITQPFAISKYEVTFDEWDACAEAGACNGYKPDDAGWGRGRRPVINVSWHDAAAYVEWLAAKTAKTYRLPSETEWEYAARAGTTTPFWWGSSITPKQANYNGDYLDAGSGSKGKYPGRTLPVDSFAPNPWGLHNVHGNVWEWTRDCWHENNLLNPRDGSARTAGNCSYRVIRGGSWSLEPKLLRSAYRHKNVSDNRDYTIGFRIMRELNF